MKLIYPILCSLLLSLSSFAAGEKDSLKLKTRTTSLLPSAVPLSRTFKQLDNQLDAQHASYGDQKSAFTKEYIAARFAVDSTLQDLLAPAVGTFNTLDESGNYVDALTPADLVSLPVGLRETIAGVQYSIGVSGVRFVRDYYELTIFVKVVIPQSDGAGLLNTLLQTGEIEEPVYLKSTEGQITIHGPPIVTGVTEAGVRAVTDITGTVILVYDLAVDKQTRNDAWQGLLKVKEQIQDNPSTLWSLLGEAILEEATGNTSDEWNEATDKSIDSGKRKHLYSKGTVRTVTSVVLSGKLITKLPQIADDLIAKMSRAEERLRFKNIAELKQDLQQNLEDLLDKIKTLPEKGKDFLSDFSDAKDEILEAFLRNPDLVESWKRMKDLKVDEGLRRNIGVLDALSKPKGSRPDPSEYLNTNYINNHLKNFEGGVTKITSYIPSGTVGPPGGTFVLPKSKAGELINQAKGDVNKLEDLLGLERGDLGSNPYRVDVDNPEGLRMPDGNEPGVNEFWIPGGKTSGGTLEATIDQIQPGTYTSNSIF